jgi:hypothetical protein
MRPDYAEKGATARPPANKMSRGGLDRGVECVEVVNAVFPSTLEMAKPVRVSRRADREGGRLGTP